MKNRTVSELLTFEEKYALDTFDPYCTPDERDLLEPVPADVMNEMLDCVGVNNSSRSLVRGCEADNAPGGLTAPTRNLLSREPIAPGASGNAGRTDERRRNNPPANNMGVVKYRSTYGGFDGGVEAGFSGEWSVREFEELKERLCNAKESADQGDYEKSYVDFGGEVWKVWAKGSSGGGSAPKYKFILERHGIKLYLHNNPQGNIQPLRVRFGAVCLQKVNLYSAVKRLKQTLFNAGFRCSGELLTRVDMQILMQKPMQEFVSAWRPQAIVTQCRGLASICANMENGQVESITLGSNNIELCIYNKMAEIRKKSPVEYATFAEFVVRETDFETLGEAWGKDLTRVEFRFRRDILKRFGVNTFDDLRRSQLSLIQIASRDWFRILDSDKVRGSENEQALHPLWLEVVQAFEHYFSVPEANAPPRSVANLKSYRPVKKIPQIEKLIQQAAGCLSTACALAITVKSRGDLLSWASDVVKVESGRMYVKTRERQFNNKIVYDFTPGERSIDKKRE